MNKEKLETIKKSILVFDIETSAQYPNGEVIDIRENFEDYVKHAKVKWLGMYSYLHDEYNEINVVLCIYQNLQNQYIQLLTL